MTGSKPSYFETVDMFVDQKWPLLGLRAHAYQAYAVEGRFSGGVWRRAPENDYARVLGLKMEAHCR